MKRALFALMIAIAPGLALASQSSLVMPTTGTVSGLTLVQNINLALDALVTENSGSSAPTNAAAGPLKGQRWLDTSVTPNLLKIYDGTQWITVGSMDTSAHVLRHYTADGSTALPGYSFASDVDTGIRLASAGDLRIVIGGTDIFKFTSAGAELLSGDFNSVPVGTVSATIGSSADTGYLFAYGQCIADATYPALTTKLGSTYGTGCGAGNTRMPDLRGRKIQGADAMGGSAANVGQVSTTITTINGNSSATVGSATGLAIGMFIKSTNVTAGTTITAISGTTVTMSAGASGSGSGTAARFSPVTDAEAPGAVGGEKAHANVVDEMASHNHGGATGANGAHTHDQTNAFVGIGTVLVNAGATNTVPDQATDLTLNTVSDHTHTISSQGGGRVANVTDPTMVLNYQVKY